MHNKLYKIVWRDASGFSDGENEWFHIDAIKTKAEELYQSLVETVGYILENNKNYVVIAATKSEDNYADISMIPKNLIIKREPL